MINLSKKLKFALLSLFVLPTMAQVEQVKNPYGYLYCHMSRKGEWTAFALSKVAREMPILHARQTAKDSLWSLQTCANKRVINGRTMA